MSYLSVTEEKRSMLISALKADGWKEIFCKQVGPYIEEETSITVLQKGQFLAISDIDPDTDDFGGMFFLIDRDKASQVASVLKACDLQDITILSDKNAVEFVQILTEECNMGAVKKSLNRKNKVGERLSKKDRPKKHGVAIQDSKDGVEL